MNIRNAAMLAVLTLGLGMAACQKKEETPVEKVGDAIGDATNSRDNEKMKDAGENAADAVKDAGEAAKEAVDGDGK